MYINVTTKGTVSSFLISKLSCEQPSFHIGMKSSPLTRKFHKEHDEIYCDLPDTFILNKFAFTQCVCLTNFI